MTYKESNTYIKHTRRLKMEHSEYETIQPHSNTNYDISNLFSINLIPYSSNSFKTGL